jgi:hypothetical protein
LAATNISPLGRRYVTGKRLVLSACGVVAFRGSSVGKIRAAGEAVAYVVEELGVDLETVTLGREELEPVQGGSRVSSAVGGSQRRYARRVVGSLSVIAASCDHSACDTVR